MAPAFSSLKQAGAFALLLLTILLMPALMPKSCLPPRDQLYSSTSWGEGAFPYLHDQIFNEKEDIDIAFMGSSPIWWGIDTPYVQQKLSEKLGRRAVVRSLCWNWNGYDAFYFIAQDLLQRRKVRMIVFYDLQPGAFNTAHPQAPHWFRFADNWEGLDGLPLRSKASFYSCAILGMPRNLLGLLRDNLPPVASDEITAGEFSHMINPSSRLGSFVVRQESGPDHLLHPLAGYTPQSSAPSSDVCVYSEATREHFQFSNSSLWPMQEAFVRKIGALAQEHQTRLVFLHMPEIREMRASLIEERTFWPDVFRTDIAMVGISPAKLFSGMKDEEVRRLYWDFMHFNENGQKYFTPIVTPALIHVYEEQINP